MMPRSRARSINGLIGNVMAVGEVMWLMNNTRVRSVTPDQIASITSSADRIGHAHRLANVLRAVFRAQEAPRPIERAVFVIGGQHFIAGTQIERSGDDVQAHGRVRHVHQIVGIRAEIAAQSRSGCQHQIVEAAAQEFHRLPFQFALPALILVEDRARTRAERAVIEKDDVGIEQKEIAHAEFTAASPRANLAGRDRFGEEAGEPVIDIALARRTTHRAICRRSRR